MPRRLFIAFCLAAAVLTSPVAAFASDGDSDKVEDDIDNCVGANPFQFDADRDGEGDLCERPIPMSDLFEGTPAADLMFGGFRDSVLSGAGGTDSLYGEGGDDMLDGGPGLDSLAGGPGNDRLIGGEHCDVFGIETRIEQRDIFVDFSPAIDRVRFPPLFREAARNRLPQTVAGGVDELEVSFVVGDEAVAVVVFSGMSPNAPLVLSTQPCGEGPPPASICPKPGARRSLVFVGFEDRFCPDDGEMWLNTGIRSTARYNWATGKLVGPADE